MGKCQLLAAILTSGTPERGGGVRFLSGFGLKTGTDFAHFGLESGMVFEGTTRVYEGIYRFNSVLKDLMDLMSSYNSQER